MPRNDPSISTSSCCTRVVVAWIAFLALVVKGNISNTIWYITLLSSTHGWQNGKIPKLLTSSPTTSNVPISAIPSKPDFSKHDQPSPMPNVSSKNTTRLVSESTLTPTTSLSPSTTSISSKKINMQFIAGSTLSPTTSLSPSITSISSKKINTQFIAESTLSPTTSLSPSITSISSKKINTQYNAESTLSPTTSLSPSTTLVSVTEDNKAFGGTRLVSESTSLPTTSLSPSVASILVKDSSLGPTTRLPTSSMFPSSEYYNELVLTTKPYASPTKVNIPADTLTSAAPLVRPSLFSAAERPHEFTVVPTTSDSPSQGYILTADSPTRLPTLSTLPSSKYYNELVLTTKPNASPTTVDTPDYTLTAAAPLVRPSSASAAERPHEFTVVPTTSNSPSQGYILTAESSSETPTKLNTHSLTFPVSNLDEKTSKPAATPEPTNIIGVVTPRLPTATQPSRANKNPASWDSIKTMTAHPSSAPSEETPTTKPSTDEVELLQTVKLRTATPTKEPEMLKSTLPSMVPTKKKTTYSPTIHPAMVPTLENHLSSQNNMSAPYHSTSPILPSSTLSAPPPATPSNNSQISTITESIGTQTTTKPSNRNSYIVVVLLTANIALLLIIVATRSTIIRLRESRGYERSLSGRDGSFPIATTTPRRTNRVIFREKPRNEEEENPGTITMHEKNDALLTQPEILWEEQKTEIMETTETAANLKRSGVSCMPLTLNTMVSEEVSKESDLMTSTIETLVTEVSPQGSLETPKMLADATIASPTISQRSGADCSTSLGFLNTMSTTSGSIDFLANGFGSDNFAASSESSFVRAPSMLNESYPEDEMSDSNGQILKERSESSIPDESIEEDMFFLCGDRWYNDEEGSVLEESRNEKISAARTNGQRYDSLGSTHRRSNAKYIGTSSRYNTPSKFKVQEGAPPKTPQREGYRTDSSDGETDDYDTRGSLSRTSTSLDQGTATSSSYTPGRSSVYAASETTSGYWSSSKHSSQSSSTDTDDSSYNYRSPPYTSRSSAKGRSTHYIRRRYSLSPLPPRKPYL